MGLETLIGHRDAGTTKIDQVERSIKRTVRGVTPDFAPLYVIVKEVDG